jgi:hypothetical protein
MLNMTIRGEINKQKRSAFETLMSAVTITTSSGPLRMRGERQITFVEETDHPLIGRPVLDETGFVASHHLDCYALLRMRPLSRSWAECSVVISCGKVDYDKSGCGAD